MRPRALKLSFVLLVAVLLALPFIVSAGNPADIAAAPMAQGNQPEASPEGYIASPEGPAPEAAHVWTREEMANAIPISMPDPGEAALDELGPAQGVPTGKPGMTAGSLPEGAKAFVPQVDAINSDLAQAGLQGYGYPAPFTRYWNFDSYLVHPYRTVGKVFFTQRDGHAPYTARNYVASAATIGRYVAWTAGHVVHNGHGNPPARQWFWSYNFIFVPAYANGASPLQQWPAKQLWTSTSWYFNGQNGQFGRDMGIVKLWPRNGVAVGSVTGWLGLAWNWGVQQHWFSMGYPAAAPFDGRWQWICAASYAYSDGRMAPPTVGIGCDMTGGCSGGPWIWRFGSGNYLNGNNSYRYNNHPGELFSPFFDSFAKTLWDASNPNNP